ncbi:hypothetical protein E2320_021831, partial [Naja naja]
PPRQRHCLAWTESRQLLLLSIGLVLEQIWLILSLAPRCLLSADDFDKALACCFLHSLWVGAPGELPLSVLHFSRAVRTETGFSMADSLLNHSWPSFSRRWMKRWSFKRGSDCKRSARDFPSNHTVPTSGCNSPNTLSPSLIAEDEVFFGSMAEERDILPCIVDSSTEDLLSIDSALQGSEYYKDLEFAMPTESNSNMGLRLDWTSQETPGFCSSAKNSAGCEEMLANTQSLDTPASFETAHHYLEEVHACPCSSGNQGSFVKSEQEQTLHGEEGFPVLTRSMSTSRRHSWESLQSPTDAQRRFSLDASELGSDTEREEEKEKCLPDFSPPLSWSGLETWSASSVNKVEDEPLCQNLGLVEKLGNVATNCAAKNDGLLLNLRLMVQEVLKELAQYHRCEESPRNDKTEKGTKVKRRLSNLRNRVTGSWQKEKGKNKDREKEAVEAKERTQALHGHELALGAFSNGTCCSLCGKILLNKTGLQC